MKRIVFLIVMLSLAAQSLFASASVTVTGAVRDSRGEPLSGTVVTVVGNDRLYAVAGDDGRYTISVPDGAAMLRFHLLGYLTQDISLEKVKDNLLNVVLEEDLMNLETVVVTGTRTPRLLKESPILTRVITDLDIQRVDALNIGDLLEAELPGIEFSYAMDQQVTLNMQGFGGNSVLFLVDGERIAGETLDNIDYNRLNLDNVQRVEIVKGAASSLYGSNAVGGVINLISAGATEPWSVNVNARYGAHNEQRYGGSVGFQAGKLNSMTNAQYTSIDSYSMPSEGDYSTFYGGYNWSVKERLQYEPLDGLKFTARAGYFFRERDLQSDTRDRYRDFSGGLKGEWDVNDRNRIELSYGFDQYDKSDYLLFNETDVRDYSNVQHVVRGVYTYSLGKEGQHTMILGGDYMRDYLMSYQFEDNGYYIQHTADVFGQIEAKLSERWHLIGGLRYDFFSQKRLSHFSPKLSLMYSLKNWSFRGSYSGGFRAPTLKEMYMSFDMASIFMIYGNPDLEPELRLGRVQLEIPLRLCLRLLQLRGQPYHHRLERRTRRHDVHQYESPAGARSGRVRLDPPALRSRGPAGLYLYRRGHTRRRAPALPDPPPFGHSPYRVRQVLEELRLQRGPQRPRPLLRDHRGLHLRHQLRGHRDPDLSGIHDMEADRVTGHLAGHTAQRDSGQSLQLPARLLLQQHPEHRRHNGRSLPFDEYRGVFQ